MAMFTFFLVYFFYVRALVAYYYLYDRNNYRLSDAAGCRLRALCTKLTGGIELFLKGTSATTICSGLLSTTVHRGGGPPSTLGRGPPAYASGPGPRSWSPLASTRALEGDACGLGPAVRVAQGAAHGELRLCGGVESGGGVLGSREVYMYTRRGGELGRTGWRRRRLRE